MDLTDHAHRLALDRVDLVGISPAGAYGDAPPGKRPADLLPGAKSVVVIAQELNPSLTRTLAVERRVGEVSLRKVYDGHLEATKWLLNETTHALGRYLGKQGYRWMALPTDGLVDARELTALFSFKHAAVLSGLGVFGRSSLVLTPQFGARQRFAVLLTDAGLDYARPLEGFGPCEHCDACVRACPAGALSTAGPGQTYSIDRFRCQAYNNGSGGCGLCLARCPAGD